VPGRHPGAGGARTLLAFLQTPVATKLPQAEGDYLATLNAVPGLTLFPFAAWFTLDR